MAKRMFGVTVHWDEKANAFYSDSDIIGLHIEAKTAGAGSDTRL